MDTDALLLAALHAAPRYFRLPALPINASAARVAGGEAALAFAIEGLRTARVLHAAPEAGLQAVFTEALAALIARAAEPRGGDPAFQASLLRADDPVVEEHVRLAAQSEADRRAVRALVDAIAHPGKLRGQEPGGPRAGLERLYRLASAQVWAGLRAAAAELLLALAADDPLRGALDTLLASPALQRLERGGLLAMEEPVQRYRALYDCLGPAAGTAAAGARGRASARVGAQAEHDAVQAFERVAALLEDASGGRPRFRVLRGLRTPRGFPGVPHKAKEEWDAAIVSESPAGGAAQVVLLAEVKASAAAATPDFPRLLRGLQRLAQAEPDAVYALPAQGGVVQVSGASLRRLQPPGVALPPQVVYCCSGPPEPRPQWLAAAGQAALLAEPASLEFARRIGRGEVPPHETLAPVWQALASAPRLRSALHQVETARAVRESMLRPTDLVYEVAAKLARGG